METYSTLVKILQKVLWVTVFDSHCRSRQLVKVPSKHSWHSLDRLITGIQTTVAAHPSYDAGCYVNIQETHQEMR